MKFVLYVGMHRAMMKCCESLIGWGADLQACNSWNMLQKWMLFDGECTSMDLEQIIKIKVFHIYIDANLIFDN